MGFGRGDFCMCCAFQAYGLNALTGIDGFRTQTLCPMIADGKASLNALTGIDGFRTEVELPAIRYTAPS